MNSPNNILPFEYLLSDAQSWRTASASMRREAAMMLAAVVEDLSRMEGVCPTVLLSSDAAEFLEVTVGLPQNCRRLRCDDGPIAWLRNPSITPTEFIATMVIAPESGGVLVDVLKTLQSGAWAAVRNLNVPWSLAEIFTDKFATFLWPRRNGFETPETKTLCDDDADRLRAESSTWLDSPNSDGVDLTTIRNVGIIKPRDGVGCDGISLVPMIPQRFSQIPVNHAADDPWILQPVLKQNRPAVSMAPCKRFPLRQYENPFRQKGTTVTVTNVTTISHEDTYRKSSFYEQLVEHVFISEVLQEVWFRFGQTVEVLRSKVDASGYDVVLECNGYLRHIQLKTSGEGAKTASQKINVALATKPSGCVVWIVRYKGPPAKTQQGERQGVSPPCPSRLRATSELESQNSVKRTHAVHQSSRVPGDHFNFSRPLPARLAGARVLSLTIASSRCPLPCPARLAGSQVSSWFDRIHNKNFPVRSDEPTGAAFGSVSSSNDKTFARARQAGTGRAGQSTNKRRFLTPGNEEVIR